MAEAVNHTALIFFNPVIKHVVWGGTALREVYGYDEAGDDLGECWGISAHPNGDVTVRDGDYKGMRLSELWNAHKELFGRADTDDNPFPLMIKIIDAKTDLSIQVHPDDDYAKNNENGALGKTECWYILDCKPDSSLVVGHNARTREELCRMIDEGRWDEFIREIPVKKGDFIQIEPGTVHAIKGGICLLETQQSSDITYRVYDYGRLVGGKPRELHIEKSKEVIRVPVEDVSRAVVHDDDAARPAASESSVRQLISCEKYTVWRINVNGSLTLTKKHPYILATVVDGDGDLNGHPISRGDHFLIPNGFDNISFSGCMKIIASAE